MPALRFPGPSIPRGDMTSKPSINLWLDLWEELVEKGESPNEKAFLQEHCRNAPPEMIAEFRKQLRRLDRMNARIDTAAVSNTSAGTASDTKKPAKTTPKILQPGFEPVKGYVLISKLGSGGFGQVWKATGPGGHEVALKFVRLERHVGAAEQRALDVMRHVRHPHLLSCHGSWQLGKWLILMMDLADRTLLDRFEEEKSRGFSGIPADELLIYMEESAKGIDFLNEPRHLTADGTLAGIQHRDVKPDNILLQGGGVKVADFGIAKLVEETSTGHTGQRTVAYAAPECFDNKTTAQSDQYSFAVTYCLLRGGRRPFEGSPLEVMLGHRERKPDLSMLPDKERPIVARALAKTPRDRWSSCREFVAALQAVNDGQTLKTPVVKPRGSTLSKLLPPSSRWSDWRSLAPAALLSTILPLVVVWLLTTWNEPEPAPAPADLAAMSVPPVISVPESREDKEPLPAREPEPAPDSEVPTPVTAAVAVVDDNAAEPTLDESGDSRPPTPAKLRSSAPEQDAAPWQPRQLSFEPIFDRFNLFGWQEYRTIVESGKPKVNGRFAVRHVPEPGSWKIEDRQLVSDVSSREPSGFLRTTRTYSDFVLKFSFRVTPKVDSGILIRCPEASVGHLDDAGLEVQIADDYGLQIRDSSGRTGAIYRIAGPSVSLLYPDSHWNTGSIRCEGDLVEVTINGETAVRLDMSEVTALKDRPRSGFIALMTGQGSETPKGPWFKDLRIAELNNRDK